MALIAMASALPLPALAGESYDTERLPGATVAAVSIDLDGDGSREVLRIRASATFQMEAWKQTGRSWSSVASRTIATPLPDVEAGADPIVSLLSWQVRGRDAALLVTGALERQASDVSSSVCCVALAAVELHGKELDVEPLDAPVRADFIQVADLDGDGTDELVTQLSTYPSASEYAVELAVLRWTGSGFETILAAPPDTQGIGVTVGDVDGERGDEIYLTRGDSVERLVMVDGSLEASPEGFHLGVDTGGWIAAVGNDRILIQDAQGLQVMAWPRGSQPAVVATAPAGDYPQVAVIGAGGDALIVEFSGGYGGTVDAVKASVYDMDLNHLGEADADSANRDVWSVLNELAISGGGFTRNPFGYAGPIPASTTVGGSSAFIGAGMLIEPDGLGRFTSSPASVLVSSFPLALTGEDDTWIMLGDGTFGSNAEGSSTYLYPYFGLAGSPTSVLSIARLDQALRPVTDELAAIELRDAVEVTTPAGQRIWAPADGFEAVITASPGTVLFVQDGGRSREVEIGAVPEIVEVAPPTGIGREGVNKEFERNMLVLAPDGRASVVRWEGTFVAEPPELTAHSEVGAFELHATIRGRSSANASVSVDGRPVALDGGGVFRVDVDAPIWPRDVVVVARDPLGNETTQRLEIVGFLDYRGLPWAPLLGVATVGAGLVLYVRTPRRRAGTGVRWDDAILEEVDGDPT